MLRSIRNSEEKPCSITFQAVQGFQQDQVCSDSCGFHKDFGGFSRRTDVVHACREYCEDVTQFSINRKASGPFLWRQWIGK